MARNDVEYYYHTVLKQYVDAKADLEDFEKGLQDGYVTEEQVAALAEEVERLAENKDRIAYIMFLLNMPNRKKKKANYEKANQKLLRELRASKNDGDSVIAENEQIKQNIKAEINKLKEK